MIDAPTELTITRLVEAVLLLLDDDLDRYASLKIALFEAAQSSNHLGPPF